MRFLCAILALAAVALARADAPPEPKPVLVPYRLTKTQHVLVRAKINGKGPYNFILDTGAPALFVAKKTAEAAGVTADKRGWGKFDRFEVEGGVVFDNARGKVDNLFQLEGMNGLGLAGVELHGVIGYNLLARYRIEYDFTRPKLAWTKLDFEPPAMSSIGGRSAPAGLDMVGNMMKVMGAMLGIRANFAVEPRGLLGVELADTDVGVRVSHVLTGGPAANAGLMAGDTIQKVGDDAVTSAADVVQAVSARRENETIALTVTRNGQPKRVDVKLGSGL